MIRKKNENGEYCVVLYCSAPILFVWSAPPSWEVSPVARATQECLINAARSLASLQSPLPALASARRAAKTPPPPPALSTPVRSSTVGFACPAGTLSFCSQCILLISLMVLLFQIRWAYLWNWSLQWSSESVYKWLGGVNGWTISKCIQ